MPGGEFLTMEQGFRENRTRQYILKFLYDRRQTARGLVSLRANITEIKTALKKSNISQSEVVQNLEYLVDNDWVKEEIEHRSYITPQGREVLSERRTYKLTENGVAHFELCEADILDEILDGIDLSKVEGVVVTGRHNIIREEFADFFEDLDRLEDKMKAEDSLTDEDKLLAYSDIQTLKEQLVKRVPDPDIIKEALDDISWLVTIPGLSEDLGVIKDNARRFKSQGLG